MFLLEASDLAPCLIDFDFEIENQRSNMSIFTQVDVAVDNINLVPGK